MGAPTVNYALFWKLFLSIREGKCNINILYAIRSILILACLLLNNFLLACEQLDGKNWNYMVFLFQSARNVQLSKICKTFGSFNFKIQTRTFCTVFWSNCEYKFALFDKSLIRFVKDNCQLGQGNIFTPVCHSVHRGGGEVPDQVPPSWADTPLTRCPLGGHPPRQTPPLPLGRPPWLWLSTHPGWD